MDFLPNFLTQFLQTLEIPQKAIIASNFIFMLSLGFYLLQNLQWYNYSLWRTFTKHKKYQWHLFYAIFPVALFLAFDEYFCIYLPLHLIALIIWYVRLDKKLVWTNRVKRFFATCIIFLGIDAWLDSIFEIPYFAPLITLCAALIISKIGEIVIMMQYKSLAREKLKAMKDLKIIVITASFGKTSMKNFIAALLCHKYRTYATPRSVNTIDGIIADINNNLDEKTQIYIVEAGARKRGDIAKIAHLLNHQIAVIGEIGEAHLEYFKKIENTKKAKYEILESNNLSQLYLFKNNEIPAINAQITRFPPEIKGAESTLDGSRFSLKMGAEFVAFECNILGRFNIANIAVAVMIAKDFGIAMERIVRAVADFMPIEHRLQKILANGKIILDDSFNGNLGGMEEAIRIASLHKGKKIIVTPGLVESSVENNTKLAMLIDGVFDVAIITGELNSAILARNITHAQKVVLKDKASLQNILSSFTHSGDLILFANDAPNYI